MIQGFSLSALLYNACKLHLFDEINLKRHTRSTLAKQLNISKNRINLILIPLIAKHFIVEKKEILMLTPLGEELIGNDKKNTLYSYIMFSGQISMPTWLELSEGLQKDIPPFELKNDSKFFEKIEEEHHLQMLFRTMMGNYTNSYNIQNWLEKFDYEFPYNFVDIGGGTGEFSNKLLSYFVSSKSLILDLNSVNNNLNLRKSKSFYDRINFKVQNFFEPYKVRGDIFILAKVLHDWNDKQAIKILNNVSSNMSISSHIWIIETILPNGSIEDNYDEYMNALNIWALCGGKERNYNEFEELLSQLNLQIVELYHIQNNEYLIDVTLNVTEGEI